jgi:hypothetical protein
MIWRVPAVTDVEGPLHGDERAVLLGLLDSHRARFQSSCAGLTAKQLARQACPPSTLSLLGLVRHLADAERNWFRRRFGGEDIELRYLTARRSWLQRRFGSEEVQLRHATPQDRDGAFTFAEPEHAEEDWAALREEQQAARVVVARLPLDAEFPTERYGPVSLRWAVIHMTAEYAGHSGHADLLRERIDRRTRG